MRKLIEVMQHATRQSVAQRSVKGRNGRQQGTSLVEVLVVLVILVLGILSIARLFPGGFLVVRAAENATYADRLAQSAIEALKSNSGGLPEGIYAMYINGGMYFDPAVRPDDLGSYHNDPTYSDINKARYISNETITVPAARGLLTGITGNASLYIVNFGPINSTMVSVNSLPWSAKTGSSQLDYANGAVPQNLEQYVDDPSEELTAGRPQYLVDYAAGKIAVPPAPYDQLFSFTVQPTGGPPQTISFTAYASNGGTTPYTGGWFSAQLPAGPWTPGSAILMRPFHAPPTVNGTPTFDADPYEYELYAPDNIGTNVSMGALAFNSLAAGLKAQISYVTLNWHILHDDVDVPKTGSDNTIHLTLNHLKKVGDVQTDQTIYTGLFGDSTIPYDLAMLDRDTGALTFLNDTDANSTFDLDTASGSATGNAIPVSYQGGRINLPATMSGHHLRVFYEGDADWALAVQKAPSFYTRNDPGPVQVAQYSVSAGGSRVYFPLCDAGKTVEFDGIAYPAVSGKTQRLGTYASPISDAADGTGQVYVDLPITGTPGAITFEAVRGISARAVVIYKDRGSWKTRSIDTLLTQPPVAAGE